ncbi:MAG: glycosyltransferase [Patescibacteria group bacterium]
MQRGCSCIIPFHNEGQRVLDTVGKIQKIRPITKIICVDDGSDDDSAIKLAEKYPKICIVRLAKNQGKAAAIQAGLKQVTTSHVMMFDADLIGLKPAECERGINYVLGHQDVDMLVFRQENSFIVTKLAGACVSYSGQRVLKTRLLRDVFTKKVKGYQIEAAINQLCIDKKKKVYWTKLSATNTRKVEKVGFIKGLTKELQMTKETLYIGIPGYLKQATFFIDKRIPEEKLSCKIKKLTRDLLKETN